MPVQNHSVLDIAVVDKEGHPVLVVEAKARRMSDAAHAQLARYLTGLTETVPFAMLADPEAIQLYQWDGTRLSGPIVQLSAKAILQHYEPELDHIRLFDAYLISLLEAWLRDLAYHWKSDAPPGSEELRGVGLLDKLEGGTTLSQAEIGGGYLRNVRRMSDRLCKALGSTNTSAPSGISLAG